jgi:hypothetical protein
MSAWEPDDQKSGSLIPARQGAAASRRIPRSETSPGADALSGQVLEQTADRVATERGAAVHRIHDVAPDMEPGDGIIWVYSTAEVEVRAFTPFGAESLIEMIAIKRHRQP